MRNFKDDRGRSYNDVFPAIGTGDINISVMYPGTIKAFHRHAKQDDYWFIAKGNVRVVIVIPAKSYTHESEWYNKTAYKLGSTVGMIYPDLDRYIESLERDHPSYTVVNTVEQTREVVSEDPEIWSYRQIKYVTELSIPECIQTHYLSEGESLYIPAGAWHGVQVIGNDEAIMIYHITNKYDPANPDEERAPWDSFGPVWNRQRK